MTGVDESKGPEARKAWEDLMAIIGKESWGGRTVGDGPKAGIALVGWDSLEVCSRPGYVSRDIMRIY